MVTFENRSDETQSVTLRAETDETTVAWESDELAPFESLMAHGIRSTGEYLVSATVRDGPRRTDRVSVSEETEAIHFAIDRDYSIRRRTLLNCTGGCSALARRERTETRTSREYSSPATWLVLENDSASTTTLSVTVTSGGTRYVDATYTLQSDVAAIRRRAVPESGRYDVRTETSDGQVRRYEWAVGERFGGLRTGVTADDELETTCVPVGSYYADVFNRDSVERTVAVSLTNEDGRQVSDTVIVAPQDRDVIRIPTPPGGRYQTRIEVGEQSRVVDQSLCRQPSEFDIAIEGGDVILLPVAENGIPVETEPTTG